MSLKSMRKQNGLTQKEAADIFGLKYRTYQNYENGVTSPEMDTAAQFARYFGCTIGELFDLEEGSSPLTSQDEKELIAMYRNLSDDGKKALLATAESFCGMFGEK